MSWKTLAAKVTLVGCAVACMAPGCNGDVLNDSTFRLWCGDSLCAWNLDAGHVKQTSTWHADDYGVELLDTPTQISQDTREASDCMEFSAVADVDAAAGTRVQVDFNLDGVPDFDEAIAETHWGRARLLIHAPDHFNDYGDRVRVILRKNGVGRAVLAEIRLQRVETCTGGRTTLRHVAVGESCVSPAECESSVCCGSICSTCCATGPNACTGGDACGRPRVVAPTPSPGGELAAVPSLCGPGLSHGAAGAPCINANDCASNACEGATPESECFGDAGCFVTKVHPGKCR